MEKKLATKINLIVAVVFTVFTILPILAPIFAELKLYALSDAIYWGFQWFCHQRPWRSYHLFDYQLALDARMMLIFGSIAVSAFIIHFKKVPAMRPKRALLFALLMITPLAVDGIIQAIAEIDSFNSGELPFYESTNLLRSLTGAFFGTGFAFAALPFLQDGNRSKGKGKFLIWVLVSLVLSIALVPLLTLLWSLTSVKYRPSSVLLDNMQRFPGYNYEITTGGGHSTIKRIIAEPATIYLDRAERYDRQNL